MRIVGSTRSWTRDCRPRWLLEELGIPYERESVELVSGGGQAPSHRALHPLGKVPVLVEGDLIMIESGAMVLYLAERYGIDRLVPPAGTAERAMYYQWIFFSVTSLEPVSTKLFGSAVVAKDREGAAARYQEGLAELRKLQAVLAPALEGREFVVGNDFTAADVMLGTSLHWAALANNALAEHPAADAYYRRLARRPAFSRTFGPDAAA